MPVFISQSPASPLFVPCSRPGVPPILPHLNLSQIKLREKLMNTKTIPPLIATCILTLAILACNLGKAQSATQVPQTNTNESTPQATEAPTTAPAQTVSACDNPYLPVIVGATWNYKLTGSVPDTYTHTVRSLESDGFSEQDVFSKGITRQGNWHCHNGNLTALNPPSGSAGNVSSKSIQVDLQTKDYSGTTLPASLKAGDAWSQTLDLEGTETING